MTIWMKHPRVPDALIELPDDAELGHRRAGWQLADPPPPETTAGELEAAQVQDNNAAVDERPTESITAPDGNKE